jgi:cyclophilin family peptidyl-prolyl cis-trans isomerase
MITFTAIHSRTFVRSAVALFVAITAITNLASAQNAKPGSAVAPTADAPTASPVYVSMTTSKGVIYLELNAAKAPISTENFVSYTKEGFYNGTIFHRVIKTFMIQGGGFTADMKQKATKAPISNEWQNGLPNSRGAISMARTNEPNSATSQFFINTVDNKMLDQPRGGAAYAVFGKVIKGMDVVDAIAAVPTGPSSGMGDVPKTVVTIEKMEVIAGPPAMDAPAAPAAPAPTTPAAPTGTKTP